MTYSISRAIARRRAARAASAHVLGFSIGFALLAVAIGVLVDELAEEGRRQRRDDAERFDSPKPVNRVRAGTSPALNAQQPQPGVRV
ncbi:MAG: hypothetical protein ACM30H_00935 [Clostridia bacterium]